MLVKKTNEGNLLFNGLSSLKLICHHEVSFDHGRDGYHHGISQS
jgi:hypothetical protein